MRPDSNGAAQALEAMPSSVAAGVQHAPALEPRRSHVGGVRRAEEFKRSTSVRFPGLIPGKQRRWNEVQNTSKDIQLLSNHLHVQYKSPVWNA